MTLQFFIPIFICIFLQFSCFAKSSIQGTNSEDQFYAARRSANINFYNSSPSSFKYKMIINIKECDIYFSQNPNFDEKDQCNVYNLRAHQNIKVDSLINPQQFIPILINSSCCLNRIYCSAVGSISGTIYKINLNLDSSYIGKVSCITNLNYYID